MPVANEVLEQIVGFARKRGVRRLILFGSRARGDALLADIRRDGVVLYEEV